MKAFFNIEWRNAVARRVLSALVFMLLAVSLPATAADALPSPASDYAKLIVGKWKEDASEMYTEYAADGTLHNYGTMQRTFAFQQSGHRIVVVATIKADVTGTWSIEGNQLSGKVTEVRTFEFSNVDVKVDRELATDPRTQGVMRARKEAIASPAAVAAMRKHLLEETSVSTIIKLDADLEVELTKRGSYTTCVRLPE